MSPLKTALCCLLLGLPGCCPRDVNIEDVWRDRKPRNAMDTEPGRIVPAKPSHVLILPGIAGPDRDTENLRHVAERAGYSAQIWDWTRLEPQRSSLRNLCYDLNVERAGILVERLRRWQQEYAGRQLVLAAASGGSIIAHLACADRRFPGQLRFAKVVFLSGAVNAEWGPRTVTRRTRAGILFNYASSNDEILGSWLGERLAPNAIGLQGYVRWNREREPSVRDLHWTYHMTHDGNDGTHLACLQEPFLSECVVPALNPMLSDWPDACTYDVKVD